MQPVPASRPTAKALLGHSWLTDGAHAVFPKSGLATVQQGSSKSTEYRLRFDTEIPTLVKLSPKNLDGGLRSVRVEHKILNSLNGATGEPPIEGVIRASDTIVSDGDYYTQRFEFMPDGNLWSLLDSWNKAKGIIVETRRLETIRLIFQSLVTTMSQVHQRGYAHLNLAPQSVLFSRDEKNEERIVKVANFALAQPIVKGHLCNGPLATLGDAEFMAPEVRTKSTFDCEKADVYSLGKILYTMIAGELHDNPNVQGLNIGALPDSEHVSRLLLSMLHSNPKKRVSMSEVIHHIWLADSRSSTPSLSSVPPKPTTQPTPITPSSPITELKWAAPR